LIYFRRKEINSAPPTGDSPWDLAQATNLEAPGLPPAFGGPPLSSRAHRNPGSSSALLLRPAPLLIQSQDAIGSIPDYFCQSPAMLNGPRPARRMAVRDLPKAGSVISRADVAQGVSELPFHRRLALIVVIGDELEDPPRTGIQTFAAAIAPFGVNGYIVFPRAVRVSVMSFYFRFSSSPRAKMAAPSAPTI
jgi:hypothetical protein